MSDSQDNSEIGNIPKKVLNGAAYVTTAAIGTGVAVNRIKDTAFHQYRDAFEDQLKPLRKIRDDQRHTITEDFKKGTIPADQVASKLAKTSKDYEKGIVGVFEKKGLKGIGSHWQALNSTNKIKVAEGVFTTSGIALGVLLTFTNLYSLNKLFKREQKQEAAEQGRSR